MKDYEQRAQQLPVSDSEFLWALILDMARTVDLLLTLVTPKPNGGN